MSKAKKFIYREKKNINNFSLKDESKEKNKKLTNSTSETQPLPALGPLLIGPIQGGPIAFVRPSGFAKKKEKENVNYVP